MHRRMARRLIHAALLGVSILRQGYAIVGRGDKRINAIPSVAIRRANLTLETIMANEKGPNVKKKAKCKNCEGKGLVKKGDKVLKCQRCHGTGLR